MRLAHGWLLASVPAPPAALVRDFIRPAVRAVPSSMAQRLGPCSLSLPAEAAAGASSQWIESRAGLEIRVSTADVEDHDIALELLLCVGQALWDRLSDAEWRDYWTLLNEEIGMGIDSEIDEQALEQKRALLAGRSPLEDYGRASFSATAAEYVHCLWHEVTIRIGPDHLPAPLLRRRLDLLARLFPPDRGYRLFPA